MGVKHIFRHSPVFNFVGCMIHSFLVFDSVVIFLEVGSVRNISFHRKQKKAPRNLFTGNTKERQEIPYFMNQEIPYFINQIIPQKHKFLRYVVSFKLLDSQFLLFIIFGNLLEALHFTLNTMLWLCCNKFLQTPWLPHLPIQELYSF